MSDPLSTQERTPGWYLVRKELGNEDWSEPVPAQWDGRHWHSVTFRGCPACTVLVLRPISLEVGGV